MALRNAGGLEGCQTVTKNLSDTSSSPGVRAVEQRSLPQNGVDFAPGKSELRAFFDLQTHPVTFDIGNFLANAEAARVRAGCSHIRIFILPGLKDGFSNFRAHDKDHSRHRLSSIIIPAMRSLPTCSGVSILSDRAPALSVLPGHGEPVFPEDYALDSPTYGYTYIQTYAEARSGMDLQPLQAPQDKLSQLEGWLERKGLDGKKIVTVTLREASYQEDRNSNLREWGLFCAFLSGEGYQPVILRDFDRTYEQVPDEISGYPVCDVANWDLGLRIALYEQAEVSFFVNNGPQVMCFFNRNIDFMTVKWVTESVQATSTAFRLLMGDKIGQDHEFLRERQHIVWENDDFPVLVRNYRKFFSSRRDIAAAE